MDSTVDNFLFDKWTERVQLHENVRYESPPVQSYVSLAEIIKGNWSPEFVQGMQNRMVMGHFRYGPCMTQKGYNYVKYIRTLCDRYDASKNTEFMIDIANMALIEFKRNPGKFKKTDDGLHHQKGAVQHV